MSKLEIILGTTLFGVTAGYAYTVFKAIEHVKKEQRLVDEIQESCERIKDTLDYNDTEK